VLTGRGGPCYNPIEDKPFACDAIARTGEHLVAQDISAPPRLQSIFPLTAGVNAAGHLTLGGCDTVELAHTYGTPLYVFDEATLRAQCRAFTDAFARRYANAMVAYAAKAYAGVALLRLVADEGLGLDVVSGGELAIALAAGFPPERIHLHGNNKAPAELREALTAGIGRIVVDNLDELALVETIAAEAGRRADILLRLAPGVDPHTHAKITTGVLDTKFGLAIQTGDADTAVERALASPHLALHGYHCHIGSQVFEKESYPEAVAVMLGFAARMRDRHGYVPAEFSPGGGFAVQYVADQPAPPADVYAALVVDAMHAACERHGLPLPRLFVEPGRSIVARAGVALYTVGARKVIPGVRTYVSVDGGMADNIRPAMYDARYEALVANRAAAEPDETVTVAGKYCESGDILIRDVALATPHAGDTLAVPTAGAYCIPMASNYNAAPRPAIVFVRDGTARLVRRRESYEDLLRTELV
jgi:diaminopimelate decarboxylase